MDPASISFIGTAVSAATAAAAYVFKNRHERRRSTRAALYYLLEVHHFIRKVVALNEQYPSLFLELIEDELAGIGAAISSVDRKQVQDALPRFISAFVENELHDLAESIAEPFAKTLAELSREDPFLAFKLRGRDKLILLSQRLSAANAKANGRDSETDAGHQVLPLQLETFLRELTVDELKVSLLQTAARCGVLTSIRVRRLLRTADHESSRARMSKKIKPYIQQLVRKMVADQHPAKSTKQVAGT